MNRLIITLLLALVGFQAFAQYDRPWLIHDNVKVIDEVTKKLVRGAEFTLFDTHGRQIEIAYSHEQAMTINGEEKFLGYSFSIEEFVDTLVVRATIPGHEPAEAIVPTPRNKYEEATKKDGRFWWRDEIRLMTRRSMNIELGEAEVTASRILMVQKGDTIIYNAAALQMSSGSMLNNLVRALPGVQLGANGRITVNGEYVQSLLVNGKDFFKGDPNVALDNLPYYTVDKIKVYHKGVPDLTNATHLDSLRAASGEKPLVMDVRLKKEYGEGWLSNFEVASGFRTTGAPGLVHRGRAFALRFTDHSKLGIYAAANNVGDNANPTHNGEWREMNAAGYGENTVQNAGIDFSIEDKEERRKFSTTLKAKHSANETESQGSSQSFLPSGDVFKRSHSLSHGNSAELNWNANYTQSRKGHYSFSLAPFFSCSKSSQYSMNRNATFDGDPLDATHTASLDSIFTAPYSQRLQQILLSSVIDRYASDFHNINTGLSASSSIRMPFSRHNLSLSASINYLGYQATSVELSEVSNLANGHYNEHTRSVRPTSNFSWNAGASYPLFYYAKPTGWANADLSYNFSHNVSNNEDEIRKNDLPFEAWDNERLDIQTGLDWTLDGHNTYNKQYTTDAHSINFEGTFQYQKLYLRYGLPFRIVSRYLTDTREGITQRVQEQRFTFSPTAGISIGKFNVGYNLQTSLPEIRELLDISDTSYSLVVRKGNPDLHPAYTHALNMSYSKNRPAHSEWLKVSASSNIIQHEIKDAYTFDRNTSVSTYQSRNTEGNWWASAKVGYGRAFDKAKRLNFSTTSVYTFAHSVGFVTDASSPTSEQLVTLNHRIRSVLRGGYSRGQMRVDLSANFAWHDVNSDRVGFQHLQYADHSYGLTFATPLFPGVGKDKWTIDFDTDVKLYLRRGYREPSMNTTEWVWNAALSTRVGKTKQWTLRAVGFDLLHQLSNITHNLTAQSFSETWTNTVRSYVSFHVVYHLNMKPKKGIE